MARTYHPMYPLFEEDDYAEPYIPGNVARDWPVEFRLTERENELVYGYLEEPVESGVYILKTPWLFREGISNDIFDQLKSLSSKEKAKLSPLSRRILEYEKVWGETMMPSPFENQFEKLTFIMKLLAFMSFREQMKGKPGSKSEIDAFKRDEHLRDVVLLDINKVRRKYKDAYEHFKNEVECDAFKPLVQINLPCRLGQGYVILTDSLDQGGWLSATSLERKPLQTLGRLLELCGKISSWKVKRVFSPEEIVLAPYMVHLRSALPDMMHDPAAVSHFDRAHTLYEERKFTYCVSTIGLACEDYLTRIYESLFRAPIPKNHTLGEVFNLIGKKTKQQLSIEKDELSNLDPTFGKLNKMLAEGPKFSKKNMRQLVALQKTILKHLERDREWLKAETEPDTPRRSGVSIFPQRLRENIVELISYRNATAHRTRTTIDDHESLRSAYCCVSLALWWERTHDTLDFDKSSPEILAELVSRNTGVKTNE